MDADNEQDGVDGNGRRGVTPNTALRLERATGMDAEFWLGLQRTWDLWHELQSADMKDIEGIEPLERMAELRPLGRKPLSAEVLVQRRRTLPYLDPERLRGDIDRILDPASE